MPKLKNVKHELFCHEYLKDLNAKQAYLRVYKCKNEKSAETRGPKLFRKVEGRVNELKAAREKRVDVNADYVLSKYRDLLELDMTFLLDAYSDFINECRQSEEDNPPDFKEFVFNKYKEFPANVRKMLNVKLSYGKYGPQFGIDLMSKDEALKALANHVNIGNKVKVEGDDPFGHKSLIDILHGKRE